MLYDFLQGSYRSSIDNEKTETRDVVKKNDNNVSNTHICIRGLPRVTKQFV